MAAADNALDLALDLEESQIVEPLDDRELEVSLPSAKLAELRRRYPSGTGQFFVNASGEVVFLSRRGATVPVTGIRKPISRALFERRHKVDTRI